MATASLSLPRDSGPAVTTTLLDVSPAMARDWLDKNLFVQQRRVRPAHVRLLVQLMQQGHFRVGSPLDFGVLHGKKYLVNGQHTLHALLAYGAPLPLTVTEYRVPSPEALAALYGTFDRPLRRTASDVYTAHAFAQQAQLRPKAIDALAGAMSLVLSGFDEDAGYSNTPLALALRNPEVRLASMRQWVPEAQLFFDQAQVPTLTRQCLYRSAVVAVGLVTLRYCRERAIAFWGDLIEDNGLHLGEPPKTLLRWLYDHPMRPPRTLYARYVAAAWNAWHDRREVTRLLARAREVPILIAGTPHDGQQVVTYHALREEEA